MKNECWNYEKSEKLIFAVPPLANARFSNPRHPPPDPKSSEKATWKQAKQIHSFWSKGTQKTFENGSLNPPNL